MFGLLIRLPFLPVTAVVRLGEIIVDEVDREFFDPAAIRRRLEEAALEHEAGLISDAEYARIERQATAAALQSSSQRSAR